MIDQLQKMIKGIWGRLTSPRTGNRQPNREDVAQAVSPGTGGQERDAAEQAPEDQTQARENAREKMKITTMTDNKVKELITKVQE